MTETPLGTPMSVTPTVVTTTYDVVYPYDLEIHAGTFVPWRLEVKVFEGGATVIATLTGRLQADRGQPHGEDLLQTWIDGPADSGLPRSISHAPAWVREAVQGATAATAP